LDTIGGTVFTAGDNAYDDGTAEQFAECYDPAWGRHLDRTYPAPGNHDYRSAGARPYFDYFGQRAGPVGAGYYSYDLGSWHIIVLNSNCGSIGGCETGSPQGKWLQDDLLADKSDCTLAYWHHPVLTAGPHDNDEAGMIALWQALYDAGVDVVLNGHDHNYQRYAPLSRDTSAVDEAAGMRLFIVGTGGRELTASSAERIATNRGLEAWADAAGDGHGSGHVASYGVIKFTLAPDSYAWEFVPAEKGGFTDSGSASCH
jgi:hypothetical protein